MRAAIVFCLAIVAQTAHALLPVNLSARLENRTDRYGHNVLGGNEYTTMVVAGGTNATGQRDEWKVTLPPDRVFEDITVRLAYLGPDARPVFVVVESSRTGGAELAIYGFVGDRLAKIASTPSIGRRNRWLAPAGIADFDGDGQNDIAYVEKPHIGGMLRIWTMRDGELVEIAQAPGFSNHHIGEDFITGGVRDCGNGPELVLPNFNWSRLMVVRYSDGALKTRVIGDQTDAGAVGDALACRN